jgi:hypothetical protein
MSSRELIDELLGIVLVTEEDGSEVFMSAGFLPAKSALNTALRGGDWSAEEYREARVINELASSRADGRGYTPDLVMSPAEIAAEKAHQQWQKDRHDDVLAQLRGERR